MELEVIAPTSISLGNDQQHGFVDAVHTGYLQLTYHRE